MNTIIVRNVDTDLLARQKAVLVEIAAHFRGLVMVVAEPEHLEAIEGVIHLLDAMGDQADPPSDRRGRLREIRTLAESLGVDQAGIDIADRCTAELEEED